MNKMEKDITLQYEKVKQKLRGMNEKWVATWKRRPKWLAHMQRVRIGKKAWKTFKFFANQKNENESALTIHFLTKAANDFSLLDMVNYGYQLAIKNGSQPIIKTDILGHGEVQNIYDFIFYRWPVLAGLD